MHKKLYTEQGLPRGGGEEANCFHLEPGGIFPSMGDIISNL